MKKYIQCTLKENPSIIMNVEKAKNIEYLNKDLWTIKEKSVKELPHLHVSGNARVCGDAQVSGNAKVYGNALVFGHAIVVRNAQVSDYARVYGSTRVFGNSIVSDYARVYGSTRVCGDAKVCGNAYVFGNSIVSDYAQVFGNAYVYGKAKVCRNALVYAHSELYGEAIATTKTYNIPFLEWNVTLSDNHIRIGCKQWTYEDFLRLNEIHIGLEYSQEEYSKMENAKNIIIDAIKLKRPDLFKKEEE